MTCKCGSTRIMNVFAKHSDLAAMSIPHLNFDHDGYMPPVGPFGGDDFNIDICLDCGTIQDWKPISDKDLAEALNQDNDGEEEDEDEEDRARVIKEKKADREITEREPPTISLAQIEEQRIKKLLVHAFGAHWWNDDEAAEILRLESTTTNNPTTRAVCLAMLAGLDK
jgi:hypothetical protein